MAFLEGSGRLTVHATVTHTGGWDWNSRWLMTTKYLVRLRELYKGSISSNTDLWAVVNSFMIECAHMWDAFKNDPQLTEVGKAEVQAAMDDSPMLQLCRDYANTYKHLKRDAPVAIVAEIWEDGDTEDGNFVTIGYGPVGNPRASMIDALDMAEAAYAAWKDFMTLHGIPEQTQLIAPLLGTP